MECQLLIDGVDVPIDRIEFSTPRHVFEVLGPKNETHKTSVLGTSGFGVAFCGPEASLSPYLDGEMHDITILPIGVEGPALPMRVRLNRHNALDGVVYGYGVMTDENLVTPSWKEVSHVH